MATFTTHVNDMTDGAIEDGTAMYIQVRDPTGEAAEWDRWSAFDADNAQWRLDNPDRADPKQVPHCAVATPGSPTLPERLFMQSRFLVETTGKSGLTKHPATWMQLNSTNFSAADLVAGRTFVKAIYDAQRIYEDLVPA